METSPKITPLRDYLVLEEVKVETKTNAILLTGDEDTKESPRAKIIAVGPKVHDIFTIDQHVIFKPHMCDQFYPDVQSKKPYLLCREEAIIAKLND